MSNIKPGMIKLVEIGQAHLQQADDGDTQALHTGGGGGTFDGMEARVAKLEVDMEYIKRDVSELRSDMRDVRDRTVKIESDVSHLPSKAFVFSVYGIIAGLLAAVILFQSQIQTFLGVMPPAN